MKYISWFLEVVDLENVRDGGLCEGGSFPQYIELLRGEGRGDVNGGGGRGEGGGGGGGWGSRVLECWFGRVVLVGVRLTPFEIIIILDEDQFTALSGFEGVNCGAGRRERDGGGAGSSGGCIGRGKTGMTSMG